MLMLHGNEKLEVVTCQDINLGGQTFSMALYNCAGSVGLVVLQSAPAGRADPYAQCNVKRALRVPLAGAWALKGDNYLLPKMTA